MQDGGTPPHSRARWVGAGTVALLMLAFAAPASAADEDMKGWYLALDVALTQPNGLDQDFANQLDNSTSPPRGRRLVMENDDDATYRGMLGYNFGLGLGGLQVSYWSFDNDDQETASLAGFVIPSLFGYGYYGAQYLYNPAGSGVVATSDVKATTLDLDYVRAMDAGERFTLRWLAGLRVATYEEEQGFAGSDGTYYAVTQVKRIDADAVGFKVGATAGFNFTDHFGLEGGLSASLLQAQTEGESGQTITDLVGGGTVSETNEGEDDYLSAKIIDLDVKAVWGAGPVDVYLGYSASSWDGLVKDPVPPKGFLGISEGPSRDSISFNSWQVGLRWFIGGRGLSGP